MSRNGLFFRGMVALTLGMTLAPAPALADQPTTAAARTVRDVALESGGVLRGQLVDPAGLGQSGLPVSVRRNGQEVASTATDGRGAFSLAGLSGGNYQLVAGSAQQDVRLWSVGTAPPAAVPSALIVSNGSIARGQVFAGMSWSTAGAITAAGLIGVGAYAITQSDSGS